MLVDALPQLIEHLNADAHEARQLRRDGGHVAQRRKERERRLVPGGSAQHPKQHAGDCPPSAAGGAGGAQQTKWNQTPTAKSTRRQPGAISETKANDGTTSESPNNSAPKPANSPSAYKVEPVATAPMVKRTRVWRAATLASD